MNRDYGRFVGSWSGTVVHHDAGGLEVGIEVHFAWALEGRAVQDVWITPPRGERGQTGLPPGADWYGTTLRVYDPKKDRWDITWIDPSSGLRLFMVGRRLGDELVQTYRWKNGTHCRWVFTDIETDAFRWLRQESGDEQNWQTKTEIRLESTDRELTSTD